MPTTTSKTTHLMVVDPRPDDYLELATEVLSAAYQMSYATCGEEALRVSNVSPAGLWLINFQLPDMTGVELLTQVRSRDANAACVLISNVYSAVDEISARQFGATLYACKPLQASWLQALPAFCQPRDRDHSAHGPPSTRAAPHAPAKHDVAASTQQHHTKP